MFLLKRNQQVVKKGAEWSTFLLFLSGACVAILVLQLIQLIVLDVELDGLRLLMPIGLFIYVFGLPVFVYGINHPATRAAVGLDPIGGSKYLLNLRPRTAVLVGASAIVGGLLFNGPLLFGNPYVVARQSVLADAGVQGRVGWPPQLTHHGSLIYVWSAWSYWTVRGPLGKVDVDSVVLPNGNVRLFLVKEGERPNKWW